VPHEEAERRAVLLDQLLQVLAAKYTPGTISISANSALPCSATNGPLTGPPTCTAWVHWQAPSPTFSQISLIVLSVGRLSTTPNAPSSP
jgi:hypothetical protein